MELEFDEGHRRLCVQSKNLRIDQARHQIDEVFWYEIFGATQCYLLERKDAPVAVHRKG